MKHRDDQFSKFSVAEPSKNIFMRKVLKFTGQDLVCHIHNLLPQNQFQKHNSQSPNISTLIIAHFLIFFRGKVNLLTFNNLAAGADRHILIGLFELVKGQFVVSLMQSDGLKIEVIVDDIVGVEV